MSRTARLLILGLMAAPVIHADDGPAEITLFSQTYCAACEVAKRYLDARDVPYQEFNITDSALARQYFEKLGGRGTPFFMVNNKRMQGFNSDTFWSLYGMPEPEGESVKPLPLTPAPAPAD